jgi:hypothetical protein
MEGLLNRKPAARQGGVEQECARALWGRGGSREEAETFGKGWVSFKPTVLLSP